MKFVMLRDSLLKGLSCVEKITGKNLVLPIINNALLSAEKNHLKITTTDLEIAISYWDLAKIEEDGEITVPVKVLNSFISSIDDQKLEFLVKNKILQISGKNYKTQIKGLDPKDFPIIPKIEKNDWVEMNPIVFCGGINQVADFCSIAQARPELSGVYFNFSGDYLRLVATDSFRLAEKKLIFEKSQKFSSERAFILPKTAAREVINIFGGLSDKIKIYFSPNQVMFESYFPNTGNPRAQLISRLIEGEFPNYKEIIPKSHKTKIVADREKFLSVIKSAGIFSGRGGELKMVIDSRKNNLEMFAQDSEVGETNVSFPAKIEGEKVDICFNHKFLIEGVSKIKSKEICLELNGDGGPGLLKSTESDQDFIYILMPIKSN